MDIEGSEATSRRGCCTRRVDVTYDLNELRSRATACRSAPERAEESGPHELDHAGFAAEHHRALPPRRRRVLRTARSSRSRASRPGTRSYAKVAERVNRLAGALQTARDRCRATAWRTLCWNHQEHLEAYFAIPCMGAVLHTLNLRLPPSQLAQIINHAQDRVVIVDDSLAPLLASVIEQCPSVEKVIVVGSGAVSGSRRRRSRTRRCSPRSRRRSTGPRSTNAARRPCATRPARPAIRRVWRTATARCSCTRSRCGERSASTTTGRLLIIVPMFHVNAWGTPYAGWMVGSDLLLPGAFPAATGTVRLHPPGAADVHRRRADDPHRRSSTMCRRPVLMCRASRPPCAAGPPSRRR